MANKAATFVRGQHGVVTASWTINTGDVGNGVVFPDRGDIDVQLVGTLGASAVAIEGSMDNTNWATVAIVPTPLVAATISRLSAQALYLRPNCTGGAASGLVITMCQHPIKV